MMNIIQWALTILVAFLCLCTTLIASAEDSKSKVSVGSEDFEVRFKTIDLDDSGIMESTITCTKVSNRVTRCVSTDELGWADTMVCVGKVCKTVSTR